MKQADGMEEGVREGYAEKVPFCVFYDLFYNVPGGGGQNQADSSAFLVESIRSCRNTMLLLSGAFPG